jgi:UDP-N-acetylmuramoyl-tripeptide--D-alanyl-D-alanine ligase
MQSLKCSEIIGAVNGKLLSGNIDLIIDNISIDSRNIKPGDLFIPIIGERFDGHDFIISSFENGAAIALTERNFAPFDGKTLIKVKSTLAALRDLAAFYRSKFNIPFIAITGSVGKTSTKDIVASVLSQKYKVLKTAGNFNNEIGLPLSIFRMEKEHEVAIFEMGMSGFGEISRLSSIVRPDYAVITNIGLSHIDKFGSRQNILKAKTEIFEFLSPKGVAILNGDDNLLHGLKDLLKVRTLFYGTEEGLDYQAYDLLSLGEQGCKFKISINDDEYNVRTSTPGFHNVYNALAAISLGIELNVPMDLIIKGIYEYKPSDLRLNIVIKNDVKIINDTYNASPKSMEAALDVLKDISTDGKRIAVLGDMLEMGEWSYKVHLDVGKYAALKGVDLILTVGENAQNIAVGALSGGISGENVKSFDDNKSVCMYLEKIVKAGDIVLVKGSRGMKMEQIVQELTK